jgi:hypothetical protein
MNMCNNVARLRCDAMLGLVCNSDKNRIFQHTQKSANCSKDALNIFGISDVFEHRRQYYGNGI